MKLLTRIKDIFQRLLNSSCDVEGLKLLQGKQLSFYVSQKTNIRSLQEVEFQIFSQFGDDGIIQYLIHKLDMPNKTFIEFGVENYFESNTRFLLMNDNWSGFVMDGSDANMSRLKHWTCFWKYDLKCRAVFIDRDNINDLILESGFEEEIGLLHIDLDGNDYWIWKEIIAIKPVVVIAEYNSVFGIDRPIAVPYDKKFLRNKAHYSNLYWGTSLAALYELAKTKGYCFVGCNSSGNNAYFIRADKLGEIEEKTLEDGYVESKYRESRDPYGNLTFLAGKDRLSAIKGLPVINVLTNQQEIL